MWLRKFIGLAPNRKQSLETAFDPVDFSRKNASSRTLREFAASPRRQAGGGVRAAARHVSPGVGRGIVPLAGVKVP
ncbi:hypothetical protein HH297_06370 [Xanthomonas sp. Kuri4-3]